MSNPGVVEPPPGRSTADRFGSLVRSEWTKFRTVHGWVVGLVVAALVMILLSLFSAATSRSESCTNGVCTLGGPAYPVGPGGEPVVDAYMFVHGTLSGDGSLTARLTSMKGETVPNGGGPGGVVVGLGGESTGGVQPWSKAGILITASARLGAPYAAVMETGGHGVRLQYDYTGDVAGPAASVPTASPRWLRLVRSGSTVTASESPDGAHWTEVGSVAVTLASKVQVGLFVTSPQLLVGGSNGTQDATLTTATFDDVSVRGAWSGAWKATDPQGADQYAFVNGSFARRGTAFTISGSGDLAPVVGIPDPVEIGLVGAFAGLIVMIVLAALFITSEYRRGLILVTLAASPRRGRVLAAKAVVIGGVTFVAGLVAGAITLPIFDHIWRENHNAVYSLSAPTYVRVVVGTAALLGVAAVLTLAAATALRRSAGAVTGAIVLVILPFILARAAVLPDAVANWLLRLTPAAAFAVQQTLPKYSQVSAVYDPGQGYFPLAPWAGFAVLCIYAVAALALANHLLRVRDA